MVQHPALDDGDRRQYRAREAGRRARRAGRISSIPSGKAKAAFASIDAGGTSFSFWFFLRQRYGIDAWRKAAALNPRIGYSAQPVVTDLARGETVIAVDPIDSLIGAVAAGSPSRSSCRPADRRTGSSAASRASRRIRTPREVWMNWITSRRASELLSSIGVYSIRRDAATPVVPGVTMPSAGSVYNIRARRLRALVRAVRQGMARDLHGEMTVVHRFVVLLAAALGFAGLAQPVRADDTLTVIGGADRPDFSSFSTTSRIWRLLQSGASARREIVRFAADRRAARGQRQGRHLCGSGRTRDVRLSARPALQFFFTRDPRFSLVLGVLDDSPIKTLRRLPRRDPRCHDDRRTFRSGDGIDAGRGRPQEGGLSFLAIGSERRADRRCHQARRRRGVSDVDSAWTR